MSRKKKGKKVTLLEFIGNEEAPNLSPQTQYSRGGRRDEVMLPQGPRASRAVDVDLSRLPDNPPFRLLISNMSYDSEENSLRSHLGNIKGMMDVVWNYKEGRKDGTAVVEFGTRDGASAALAETDTIFVGRKIVINVAEYVDGVLVKESPWRNRDGGNKWDHDLYPQRGGWREGRGRYNYSGEEGAEPRDDWRSRNFSNNPHGDRDSEDRDSWRSVGERDRYPSGQRYRGRGGRGYSPRGSSPSGDQSPEGNRWSYSRGREDRGRGRWRGRGDSSFRQSYDREDSDEPDSWRRRPNQEREQRDANSPRHVPEQRKREQGAGGGSSIFGGAKPVDTAAREREMEEKMTRLSVRSPSESEGSRGQSRPPREFQRGRDRGQDESRNEDRWQRADNSGDRSYRGDRNDSRPYRGERSGDRSYRGDRNDDSSYRGERRDDRSYRGERNDDRSYRGERRDDRSYRGERRDDRSYRGERNDDRSYRGERRDDRSYRGERNDDRSYRRDRNDDRPYRGERRDRRGSYRDEGEGGGVRGPRRAPEERRGGKSAPRGTFKEQEQPEFAKNTRFSLLENEDSID